VKRSGEHNLGNPRVVFNRIIESD